MSVRYPGRIFINDKNDLNKQRPISLAIHLWTTKEKFAKKKIHTEKQLTVVPIET